MFFHHIFPALGILDLITCRRVSKFWYQKVLWCVNALPSIHPQFPSPHDLSTMPNLRALDLRFNESLIDEDIKILTRLTCINLSHNLFIGDCGLTALTNLRALSVSDNTMITEQTIPYLRSLTHIDARNSSLTACLDTKCPSLLLPLDQLEGRLSVGDDREDDSEYSAKCDHEWRLVHRTAKPYKTCCGRGMTCLSVAFFHEQHSHTLDTTLGFGTLLDLLM